MAKVEHTALVTGANRGLGLETCRQLARQGFRVLLTSRSEPEGLAAARTLAGVEFRALDVASAESIAALASVLDQHGIVLDVLVNNAGIALDGFDADVARRTLEVNLFGAIGVTDALAPRIRDGGCVVMVSSGMGELSCLAPPLRAKLLDPALTRDDLGALMRSFVGAVERGVHVREGWPSSAYRVSKAGLNAFVRILARELLPRRIRVNAVCPGWVKTRMGGVGAPRSVETGAASIVWAATPDDGPTGGFFRDGGSLPW